MSSNKLTKEQREQLVKDYQTGQYSCLELGRKYGIRGNSTCDLLKRRGIKINNNLSEINRIYPFDEHFFDVIDSEAKAYFLGLMYSDGCNREDKKTMAISLLASDKHILEAFSKCIKTERPLKYISRQAKNPKHHDVWTMNINSPIMSAALARLGCVQAKSLILKFPTEDQVPEKFLRHFLRGVYCGDGGLSVVNYRGIMKYYVSYTTTEAFLLEAQKYIEKTVGVHTFIKASKKNLELNKPTRSLNIAGRGQIFQFLEWLYKDANYYIQRKYDKFQQAKEEVRSRMLADPSSFSKKQLEKLLPQTNSV